MEVTGLSFHVSPEPLNPADSLLLLLLLEGGGVEVLLAVFADEAAAPAGGVLEVEIGEAAPGAEVGTL